MTFPDLESAGGITKGESNSQGDAAETWIERCLLWRP